MALFSLQKFARYAQSTLRGDSFVPRKRFFWHIRIFDKLSGIPYTMIMFTVARSAIFDRWLRRLRDDRAVVLITARLERVVQGNIGDYRPVGDGVSEMRINYGPGYRVYFIRDGTTVVVLLCGGDKGSQKRDIERAKQIVTEWRSD